MKLWNDSSKKVRYFLVAAFCFALFAYWATSPSISEDVQQWLRRRVVGPSLDGLDGMDMRYLKNAKEKLRAQARVAHGPGKRYTILLYYVPSDLPLSSFGLGKLDVVSVIREDMEAKTDHPYNGYFVSLSVYSKSPPTSLQIGTTRVALTAASGAPEVYENLGSEGRLYQSVCDSAPHYGSLPPLSLARVFLADRGAPRAWGNVSGRPLFELSTYSAGLWQGTYAVFRSRSEADSAVVERR